MSKQIQSLKKQQIKKIEDFLRRYTTYRTGRVTLQNQLNFIMPNMTASYDVAEGSNGTFNIKSDTERVAIDRIESKRALVLHEDIAKYDLIIDSIDQALDELEAIERDFIQIRYMQGKTIRETSIELGYSEKSIFKLRINVMEKLLISLRGLLQF